MKSRLLFVLAVTACLPAYGQSSASYRLDEHAINNGGDPEKGSVLSSTSYRVILDAVGDGVSVHGLAGPTLTSGEGAPARYPAPGEVKQLFVTKQDGLTWTPEPSTGSYCVYRGLLGTLPGTYGDCLAARIEGETMTDPEDPLPGQGFFYRVTARNELDEEGVKGYDRLGVPLPNPNPCP